MVCKCDLTNLGDLGRLFFIIIIIILIFLVVVFYYCSGSLCSHWVQEKGALGGVKTVRN